MSGAETTIGPLVRSSQAVEYRVSKFGRTTSRKSASGKARMWVKAFIGPRPVILPASTLVSCRRVTSIVTSG